MSGHPVRRAGGVALSFLCGIIGSALLSAQDLPTPTVPDPSDLKIRGEVRLTADFYGLDADASALFSPRRPSSLFRLSLTPVITAGEFSLPITLLVSSEQTNVTTPRVASPSLSQFVQNRANRLTLSPSYKWARLDLGTWTPRYSALTTGNQALFGAGIDLTPGPVRVAFFYGSAQAAIEPDSAAGITGAFARQALTSRVAIGDRETTQFGLNMVRVADDTGSIAPQVAGGLVPTEGTTLSADVRLRFVEKLTIDGEIAGSAFTRNLRSDVVEDAEIVSALITPRESTRLDYGGRLGVTWNEPIWGASLVGRYLGDGFRPLGYPYAQSDLAELTLSPRLSLFEHRLQLNGSLGYRVDNLQQTSAATTSRLVGIVSGTGRITDNFTLSASYANAGFASVFDEDTLKIRTISESFSLAPVLMLRDSTAIHTITLALTGSDFVEENTLTSLASINDMIGINGSWSLALQRTPLRGTLSFGYTRNNLPLGALATLGGSIGASLRLLKGKVRPSLRFSWNQNGIEGNDPDNRIGVRGGIAWRIFDRLTLQTEGSVIHHRYGTLRPDASYTELLVRSGLSTRF